MATITYDQKLILVRVMVATLDLKSSDIEQHLHISRSVVSRHLRGERDYPPIDMYLVEKFFGVRIKEFIID
ncbi:ArsR family transcriptional regulator [bacterium]|nr:ArsR family transcriptional regulator [bacterium]